jgi:hypothetical protein
MATKKNRAASYAAGRIGLDWHSANAGHRGHADWQKLAEIPADKFEALLNDRKQSRKSRQAAGPAFNDAKSQSNPAMTTCAAAARSR